MVEPIDNTILEKIRKVQGYLRSDNPNEAAVAAAKLSELLMRHNLTLSDIPDSEKKPDPFVNIRTDTDSKRLPEWRVTLAGAIARANLCKTVVSGPTIHWLGRESNVEVAQYIYYTCSNDLLHIADTLWYAIRTMLKDEPEQLVHGKTWKADFMSGAANGVRQKLSEEVEKWREEANTNALIVRNDSEMAPYVRSQFPYLGSYHSTQRGGNAYGLGHAAGRQVSFKTGVGAGGSSAPRRIGG